MLCQFGCCFGSSGLDESGRYFAKSSRRWSGSHSNTCAYGQFYFRPPETAPLETYFATRKDCAANLPESTNRISICAQPELYRRIVNSCVIQFEKATQDLSAPIRTTTYTQREKRDSFSPPIFLLTGSVAREQISAERKSLVTIGESPILDKP